MLEVYPNLYVGGEADLRPFVDLMDARTMERGVVFGPQFGIVQACKEPYHREALGYKTRGAPKDHPEYLYAYRGNRLILNLVDVDDSKYKFIPGKILDKAVEYIRAHLEKGLPVLVHCNQGYSRAPVIALLYLIQHTGFASGLATFEDVEAKFKALYPAYDPAGIREKAREYFRSL